MRNSFAQKITELSSINDKLTLLAGDIGNRLFDDFKRQNPNKFFNRCSHCCINFFECP